MNLPKTPLWLLALALLATSSNASHGAAFEWARQLTGFKLEDSFRSATMDREGNVIAVYNHLDAPDPVPYQSNLVVKINLRGEVAWTHRLLPNVRSLAAGADGTVYVAGSLAYQGWQAPDGLAASTTYFTQKGLPNEGTGGGYVALFSPTGAVTQIRRFGTSLYVQPRSLALTPEGGYYVWGHYSRGTAQFGEEMLPAPATTRTRNLFIAKFGPAGESLWVRAFITSIPDSGYATSLAVDAIGNPMVTGYGTYAFPGGNVDGGFIAKFDKDGRFLWQMDGSGLRSIPVDSAGNFYLGAKKYSPDGTPIPNELRDSLPSSSVACDAAGNLLVTGGFRIRFGETAFELAGPGELTLGDTTLTTEAEADLYVAKLSPDGALRWAVQSQGLEPAYRPFTWATGYKASWTSANFVLPAPYGGVIVGGNVFGSVMLGDTRLEGRYKSDFSPPPAFFVARIAEAPSLNIQRDPAGLRLRWAASWSGYVLESADSPSAATWVAVPGDPVVEDGQNVVSVEVTSGARFFRLRKE